MKQTMDTTGKLKLNSFDLFLKESEAFGNLDHLEKQLETGNYLDNIPVQPLYTLLRELPVEKTASFLPKLSSEQRKTILNLDLWKRDELDIDSFSYWIKAFDQCEDDEVKFEFAKSQEFSLFLKGRFNLYTFDAEDPHYPDHDNYFLTDDNLLLVEFDKDCEFIGEIRSAIKLLYTNLGVEKAYAHLFKIVSDSFLVLQEDEYRLKKEWLRDYGFVDYYEALEIDYPFPSMEVMNRYIQKKVKSTGEIDTTSLSQTLHRSALTAYKSQMEDIGQELEKVASDKRRDFLNFNFLRLVNSSLTLSDAMKEGSVAMTRTGLNTRAKLKLGLGHISHLITTTPKMFNLKVGEGVMELFDFTDLYRIGNTLFKLVQSDLKKELEKYGFEDSKECFLGQKWIDYLDASFDWPVKLSTEDKQIEIENYTLWLSWKEMATQLISILPFAQMFFEMLNELKESEKIHDSFYLNYKVEDIDFDAILLSSFANYSLGLYDRTSNSKMGITIDELRTFVAKICDENFKIVKNNFLKEKISSFQTQFGLEQIKDFEGYLFELLTAHLDGYEFENLSHDDYKHVGGPLLLTHLKQ